MTTLTDFQVATNNNPTTPLSSGSQGQKNDSPSWSCSSGSQLDLTDDYSILSEAFYRTHTIDSEGRAIPRPISSHRARRRSHTTDEHSANDMDNLLPRTTEIIAELFGPRPLAIVPDPAQSHRDQTCRGDITWILNFLTQDMIQRREYNVLTRLKVECCRIMDHFEGQLKTLPENAIIFDEATAKLFDEIRATLEYTGMMGDHYDAAKRTGNSDLGPDDAHLLQIQTEAAQRLDRTTKILNEFLILFSSRNKIPVDLRDTRVECETTTRINEYFCANVAMDPYFRHRISKIRQLMTRYIEGLPLYVQKVDYDDTTIDFSSRFRANRRRGYRIFLSPTPVTDNAGTPRTQSAPSAVYSVHLTYPDRCEKFRVDFEWVHSAKEVPQGLIGARLFSMETILAPHDARNRFKDDNGRTFFFVGFKTDRGDFYIRSMHIHPDKEVCSHDVLISEDQTTTRTVKLHL